MAQPFDPSSRSLTGQAFPLTDEVGFDQPYTLGLFSASANGVLALDMGTGTKGTRELVWFDRSGKRLGSVSSVGAIFDFALSPDERQVAFRRIDPNTQNQDIWITDLERQTESRFTFQQWTDDDPVWSPDGKTIVFDSRPDGIPNLYRKIASGTGTEELLLKSTVLNTPLDYSSDGKYVLYQFIDPRTHEDLWVLPINGDSAGKPFPYIHTAASEYSAKFSPDGRWVAYSSDESGKYEVYVQAFPEAAGKWQVSASGGGNPMWGKDGKQIYFLAPDKKLMAVDVDGVGATFKLGVPKPLFPTDVDVYNSVNRYAVTADGQRFLVNSSIAGGSIKPIEVMMHWTEEIQKQ
jgi:Tol biopolymer transport system component